MYHLMGLVPECGTKGGSNNRIWEQGRGREPVRESLNPAPAAGLHPLPLRDHNFINREQATARPERARKRLESR
jgi:hypothetical protein